MLNKLVVFLVLLAGFSAQNLFAQAAETVLIPAGSVWKYQDTGVNLGTGWTTLDYEDSGWPSGPAPLGFGETNHATVLSYGGDEDWKYATYYFRRAFVVDDPQDYNQLYLNVLRDDGVAVYLNGQELCRDNMPGGSINYLTLAVTNVYGEGERTYYWSSNRAVFQPGTNILAVELHQAAMDSIDLNFDLELTAANVAVVTRGPYLQMRSSSSILVRWRTEQPTDSYAFCGTNQNRLDLVFSDAELTTEHQVGLSNLQAQTRYYYAIASGSTVPLSAPDMFFTTAPPMGTNLPVRVWFASDYGFQNDGEVAVRDSYFCFTANSRPANIWLTGGDNDQWNGSDEREQISIFEIYARLLRNTPIWPALGNHDTYTASYPGPYPFYDNFTLPTNGEAGGLPSGSKHYFSFDYANVHFISMDSIDPTMSAATNTPMLEWLRQDLAQTRQRWKIAWWHAPPYTKGSHDSDSIYDVSGRMILMRENALPILESYGVDLVLNGHSHVYERSYFLHGHYGYSWDFSPTNKVDPGKGREDGDGAYQKIDNRGTVYVVAATGGSPQYWGGAHPAHCVKIAGQLGSCFVDINDTRLDFKFVGANTNVLDYFTILKGAGVQPRIIAVSYSGNMIHLTWRSIPGQRYQVYRQATMKDAPVLIADQILAQSTSTSWSGAVDPLDSMGFYLVALVTN